MTSGAAVLGSILTATAAVIGSVTALLRAETAMRRTGKTRRAISEHLHGHEGGPVERRD